MKEARERAPAKIIQIDMMLRLAEKQLAAEQTLTDADWTDPTPVDDPAL